MECFDCHHEIQRIDKFCSNCGRDLRPKRSRRPVSTLKGQGNAITSGSSGPGEHFIGAGRQSEWTVHTPQTSRESYVARTPQTSRIQFPNPRSEADYEKAVRARILKNGRNRIIWVLAIMGVILAATASTLTTSLWGWAAAASPALALLFPPSGRLREHEYEQISHARMPDGQLRCIHCGNRGIYVRGQYKSNLKQHECTRCRSELFISYD